MKIEKKSLYFIRQLEVGAQRAPKTSSVKYIIIIVIARFPPPHQMGQSYTIEEAIEGK